ncbi:MAG: pirin family protein [Bacteroidota bacterium]
MSEQRKITRLLQGQKTSDGAGVSLLRVFGYYEKELFDPFLLLDFFGSDHPDDYMAGFPWHPHRGIETVTYMIEGSVEHGDSMGNTGVINSGGIQWMTAGSGIIHQEMPKRYDGKMHGFQLWVNLPASKKMMQPRYQDIQPESVPVITLENGVVVKVLAGEFNGEKGPVKDIMADPFYLDVSMPKESFFNLDINPDHTVFAFVFQGEGHFDPEYVKSIKVGQLVKLTRGDFVGITTKDHPVRFILVSGEPLGQPIAWHGPIVMNTDEEIDLAFREYRNGTFIK